MVGRGGKHAKTSGRGTKGQNARAGRKKRPELRDIVKKLPKNRGYRFNSFAKISVPIGLSSLNGKFKSGDSISPKSLLENGILKMKKGKMPRIKILDGEIKFAGEFSGLDISKGALEKIKKAGGKAEEKKSK